MLFGLLNALHNSAIMQEIFALWNCQVLFENMIHPLIFVSSVGLLKKYVIYSTIKVSGRMLETSLSLVALFSHALVSVDVMCFFVCLSTMAVYLLFSGVLSRKVWNNGT